ncbi:MAG: hypothetical protein GXP31_01835 [Kiritimatiellaeota bacterium]|nr:hypothetical protein [Kiritimatiellota bacterium]
MFKQQTCAQKIFRRSATPGNGAPHRAGRGHVLAAALLLLVSSGGRLEGLTMQGFEHGAEQWRFGNGPEFPGASGRLEIVPGAAHGGRAGARLFYDFRKGGAYVAMTYALPNPAKLAAVEFDVRKPAKANLTFRATDRTGQTCQKPIEFDSSDWQRVRVRMDRWVFGWGGPADGRLRQPVTGIGILVERRGLPAEARAGHVDVDNVRFVPFAENAESALPTLEYTALEFSPGKAVRAARRKADAIHWIHGGGTLFGRPVELRVTVAKVTAAAELFLRCASHFEQFERRLGVVRAGPGEQTLTVPAPPAGWRHFGGENDGRLHGPVRLIAVGLRPPDNASVASLVLQRVTVRTQISRSRAVVIVPRHDTDARGTPVLKATLHNLLDSPLSGRFEADFRDETGLDRGRVVRNLVLPPRGRPARVTVTPPDARTLCSEIALTFVSTDGRVRAEPVSAGLARGISGVGTPQPVPESPWGIGLYLYRYPDNPDGLARMARAAALAQAAGVKWTREEILWHRTEPEKGRFDFGFYDKVVKCAEDHGISVYGLLDYWSDWTRPYTEEGIEDYCRWAARVVEHYKDRIHHWEIWNEPNIFFWSGPKELYPVLLKRAYAAIKKVDPTAKILGCSTAGIDTRFIEKVMSAKAPFDILTVHPYRGRLDDRGFIEELRDVRKLVGGRPVWITEMGWPTQVGGVTELDQARLLSRCYLCVAAAGGNPTVSWYDFREDGADPFYNEHHFGIVRYDLSPKAGYRALATVCNTLGTVATARETPVAKGFLAWRFEASDRPPTQALWSPDRSGVFLVRGLPEHAVARSFIGRDTPLQVRQGVAFVAVTPGSPVFLPGCSRAEIAGPVLAWKRPTAGLRPGRKTELRLALDNISPWPIEGRIELSTENEDWQAMALPVACAPGQKQEISVWVTAPVDAAPGAHRLTCTVRSSHGRLVLAGAVRVTPRVIER